MAEENIPTDNDIKNLQAQSDLLSQITLSLQESIGYSNKITEEYTSQTSIIGDINKGLQSATESLKDLGGELEKTNNLFEELKTKNFANIMSGMLGNISSDMIKISESAETSTSTINSALKSGARLRKIMSERSLSNIERAKELGRAAKKNAKDESDMAAAAAEAAKKSAEASEKSSNCLSSYSANAIAFIKTSVKYSTMLLKGLGSALTIAKNVLTGTLSTLYNVLKAVTSLPFAIANLGAAAGGALRKEIVEGLGNSFEGLKDKFDMSSYIGENIKSMRDMAAASILEFEKPNSELVKFFGFGSEGLRKYLTNYGELVDQLGIYGDIFAGEIRKAEQSSLLYTKLRSAGGYTAEDAKYFAMEAFTAVKSVTKTMGDALLSTDKIAKRFKIDTKMLSKNFMTLRKDIILFGHLSNDSLNETAAVMTKMGLEMKEAAAVFGKFSTFEDASNAAAILGQTFGMNLNAMDMIKAEKPEEIFGMFRNAMLDTGRTFDELSRFEKNIMVQQTGMSAEGLKAMMNYSAAGLTFEEARKNLEEDKPEKRQLKVLKQLQGAIKEIKKVLTPKSFGDALFRGLKTRIGLHEETRNTVMALSKGYQGLYEYASNMDPQTIVQLVRPIRYVIDTMKTIFESDSFRKGVTFLLKGFGSLLSTSFNITDPEIEFDRVSNRLSKIDLSKLSDTDKTNLLREIKSLEETLPESERLKVAGSGISFEEYEKAAKSQGKDLEDYVIELLKRNKKESKRLAELITPDDNKIEGGAQGLQKALTDAARTQNVDGEFGAPSNVKILGGVTQKVVHALLKGSITGITALIQVVNEKLKSTNFNELSNYSILGAITGIKEDEARQLFGGLSKALGDTVSQGGAFFDIFTVLSKEVLGLMYNFATFFGELFADAFKAALGWNSEENKTEIMTPTINTGVQKSRNDYLSGKRTEGMSPNASFRDGSVVFNTNNLFPKAEYTFIGRDNKEIDLNTKSGLLGKSSGVVSSILRDKEGMTSDLSEMKSLINDIYSTNNFNAKSSNAELKSKVAALRKKIDEAINNNNGDEKLNITPVFTEEDILNLQRVLARNGFVKVLSDPQYAQGGYYLDLEKLKNATGNTGTFSIMDNK